MKPYFNPTELDLKHIAILDSFPSYTVNTRTPSTPTVLEVGAGNGRLAEAAANLGYDVTMLDMKARDSWPHLQLNPNLTLAEDDLFTLDITTLPHEKYDIVICSEVLEHLPNYQDAFERIMALTATRLIVTVPMETSFNVDGPPPIGHCNFWSLSGKAFLHPTGIGTFKPISEFLDMSRPWGASIRCIRTKSEDIKNHQAGFLIIIDKTHRFF